MNFFTRLLLVVMALMLGIVFMFMLTLAIWPNVTAGVVEWMRLIPEHPGDRLILILVGSIGLVGSLSLFVFLMVSGRLRKARLHRNEIGEIDIGVGAIESIALNAAKASQSGVKFAKASVGSCERKKLSIRMTIMTYPDVELPVMMARVQERVKKDVEKYTGIEVAEVPIRINKVEAMATRVER